MERGVRQAPAFLRTVRRWPWEAVIPHRNRRRMRSDSDFPRNRQTQDPEGGRFARPLFHIQRKENRLCHPTASAASTTRSRRSSSALLRTVKDPRVTDRMLTITHVDTTSDLRYARIYVSALNCPDEKGLLKGLKSAAGYLRHELGSRIDLRYTPEAAIFCGRLHRLWRTHSGYAEPCQARRSPERRYRAAGGSGGLRRCLL